MDGQGRDTSDESDSGGLGSGSSEDPLGELDSDFDSDFDSELDSELDSDLGSGLGSDDEEAASEPETDAGSDVASEPEGTAMTSDTEASSDIGAGSAAEPEPDVASDGGSGSEAVDAEPQEPEGDLGAPAGPKKLSTGIEILDNPEYLDGGFPEGSVVTLIADPVATAELFLFDLAEARYTNYLTTSKPVPAVKHQLEQLQRSPDDFHVIDLYSADDPVVNATMALDEVSPGENIIVDNFSDLVQIDGYERVLNKIYQVSHDQDCLTYLFMFRDSDATLSYHESRVPYMSDVVMQMKTSVEGEKVENRLSITKLRGMTPPEKTVKLNIGEEIEVDTSRDIA